MPNAGEIVHSERRRLAAFLLLYLAASFLHFSHNAEFLGDYPNLPTWLTRAQVYFTWIGSAAVGIAGYALYHAGWQYSGLCLVGLYAALGFDGLLHYSRAPFEAHTSGMNFTIWFEVLAAAALLVVVVFSAIKRLHHHVSAA